MPAVIEETIDYLNSSLAWPSNDSLVGFQADLERFLISDTNQFVSNSFTRTVDKRVMLSVCLDLNVEDLSKIRELLLSLWGKVCYQHFQAASCTSYREATILRFVTVPTSQKYLITGLVTAVAPNYDELVLNFERRFKGMKCLESLPPVISPFVHIHGQITSTQ